MNNNAMEVQATTDKQGIQTMTIGALVGVLALMAYLFIGSRNETLEVQKLLTLKVEQFAATQTKLDSISGVLDAKITEVRQLGGSVAELERIKRQLETDKKRLKSDLSFSSQQYTLKIRDYQNFLAQNELTLRKLRTENGSLAERALSLEQEKESILVENQGLKHDKEVLARAVVDYSLQNADLKDKVTLASALKAVNIEVTAVASNGRERRDSPYRASRIDRLKVAFILPTNPLAVQNNKDIYLRILDANGAVVSESGIGGILFTDGREIGYSMRQTVPYENNDQRVAMLFRRGNPYKPGTYTVELYAEGFRIGDSRFEVR
ncbi:hypothetical protein [Spirosoma sp. 209]|uniref:hypothetical protein n=1 Tax=Spirosoma sp. 209 TaxID=1955701 RepID=UPI001F3B236A|nr:hypothetical protein [Spirosoma sp. 209]